MESKQFVLENMRNIGIQAVNKLQAEAPELDETAIIDREDYIPDFDPKKQYLNWKAGEVVKSNGQVWKLLAPYDSLTHTDIPENSRDRWGLCHTKNPLKAKPYVAPYGTSGIYRIDECCLGDDGVTVYISKIDNNVWKPEDYPDAWNVYVAE